MELKFFGVTGLKADLNRAWRKRTKGWTSSGQFKGSEDKKKNILGANGAGLRNDKSQVIY